MSARYTSTDDACDADCVALVSAITGQSSQRVAEALAQYADLGEGAAVSRLASTGALGIAASSKLRAALALGRRAIVPSVRGIQCSHAGAVYEAMRARIGSLDHEEFWALLLDSRLRIKRAVRVASGGTTSCQVSVREAFIAAITEAAPCVIFVHNHPSGNPSPSPEDEALAAHLDRAGALLGVRVCDHVIVAADGYTSRCEARTLAEVRQ